MIVVVAHGDPLRGDTSVAWRVVDLLERVGDAVVPLALRELTAELGLLLAQADGVIFVEAIPGATPGDVRSRELRAAFATSGEIKPVGRLSPEDVLGLTSSVCGVQPRAALVTIAVASGGGEASRLASRRAVPHVVRLIRRLVRDWSLDALPEGTHLDPPRIPDA
jgi:Ni,Fe-hydrogenase maturation factor